MRSPTRLPSATATPGAWVVRLDLSEATARREFFAQLGRRAVKSLILTEGLVAYFSTNQVRTLAEDLAGPPAFQSWIVDLMSPGLLRLMQKNMNPSLSESGSSLKFGPTEGPDFFSSRLEAD